MKVYVVEFTDFTIAGESGILGIYDNFESAQKRADDYSKRQAWNSYMYLLLEGVGAELIRASAKYKEMIEDDEEE